ncbi:hypothetical protein TNCV_4305071 [Trichonephila clavipes]|nr:hypothetical protein TNCV_4305071 [Trichonephila clavipes]
MEAKNENKIKQEENLDADVEILKQSITIIKNDILFEDLPTFFQKYNLEMRIQIFIRNFESTCDSFDITEKQKTLLITKLVDRAVKTYIKSHSIPKSFYELKNNLIREFGTQVNPVEIHLQLSQTEKTSKETHIEYFYRIKEIISRINMEEAEKYYVIKGLKENRTIEIQLQSCSNIEELKEKMKFLDIQEKSKSNRNEVIYRKYPVTRIPHHTNQFARRQQYGRWSISTSGYHNQFKIQCILSSVSITFLSSPVLSSSAVSHISKKPTITATTNSFATGCSNFLLRQRTQENSTVFQPHRT